MKKSCPIIFVLLFIFSSCTLQEAVNSDLFIERFCRKYPAYTVEADKIFYENDKCILFMSNQTGNRFTAELTSDLQERVYKISLVCNDADKAEILLGFAKDLISVYASDEDSDTVISNLNNSNKYFNYYETDWYSYAFSKTENGMLFSVENKRFSPETQPLLTLRDNDELTHVN